MSAEGRRLRILYLEEDTLGGGANANEALVRSASVYADVWLFTQNPSRHVLEGLNVIRIPRQGGMSLTYAREVRKALRLVRPDIVHATGMFSGVVALWLRWLCGGRFKVVATLHHTGTVFRWHAISRHLVRFLNHCDIVHYLTDYQHRLYGRFGLYPPPSRVAVIPNIVERRAVDRDRVRNLRHRLCHDSAAASLIVYAGRIVLTKRLDLFIGVIAELRRRGHDVGGVVCGAGDAEELASLRELAEAEGVSRHIVWTGHVANVAEYLSACDFGLFPTETEAQPLFVIEMFEQGKTLVASNAECLVGTLVDSIDSVITSEHSVEGYAVSAEQMLIDGDLRRKLEDGAARAYVARYDPRIIAEEYRRLYSRLMEAPRGTPVATAGVL